MFLVTRSFFLVKMLKEKFNLVTTLKPRKLNNIIIGYRIRFSGKKVNIEKLQQYVTPYMHKDMIYKIGK